MGNSPDMATTQTRDMEPSIEPVLNRVVTSDAHPLPVDILDPAGTEVNLGDRKRYIITFLILLCSLTHFISMFSTAAGGFEFSRQLGRPVGPGQANWMASAYSLTQSASVLISGRLGAIYGHQNLMLLGGAIIIIFSIANAFCPTYDSFVAVRALTGVGGGMLMPNAVATLTIMVPPGSARNITLAIFAASPPIGAWIGAIVAGAFLQYSQWKWHFIFLACFGAVVFGGLYLALPREEPVDKEGSIDYVGVIFGLGGLLLFNLSWNQAPSLGWGTPYVIVLLVASLILMALFAVWENRFANDPVMPLSLFKAPSFSALAVAVLFIYMSVGICLWYMIAWQQIIRGWTVLQVAFGWAPYAIGASMSVGIAAWLIPRWEAQYILASGCLASIAALVLLSCMPEQQTYWAQVFPATFLGSFCADFVYVAAQIIASNSVGKREQGVAGSLIGTLNLYGNSLGLGFAGTVEAQVAKSAGEVMSFRAALWFGAALGVIALVLDLVFVRMPKNTQEGWKSSGSSVERGMEGEPRLKASDTARTGFETVLYRLPSRKTVLRAV